MQSKKTREQSSPDRLDGLESDLSDLREETADHDGRLNELESRVEDLERHWRPQRRRREVKK